MNTNNNKKIESSEVARTYLDYAASAPVSFSVKQHVPQFIEKYGNPSSIHREGVESRAHIEGARKSVAQCIGALPEEIHFTSGSTEGLNLGLRGVVKKAQETISRPHIVTSAIEHPAIIETLRSLEREGAEVDYIVPDQTGVVPPGRIREVLKEETVLVVFSYIHSEIGSVLPLDEYIRELRLFRKKVTGEKRPYLFLDATQAPLYHLLNVERMSADLVVIDGGKIGALAGSGVLYVKRHVSLTPVMFGGGQERGVRPGTENIVAIRAFAHALVEAQRCAPENASRVKALSDYFVQRIRTTVPAVIIHGEEDNHSPHIIHICFPGIDAEWLVLQLDAAGISVSRGSACKSGKGNESETLRLINPACAESSVRFSFGTETTQAELERTADVVARLVQSGAPLSDD